jgi:hypothetical protein
MGGIISFVVWLFTDPVHNRGKPQLYLPDKATFTARKRQSEWNDLEKKPIDSSGKRGTHLVSMRKFLESRCPSFLENYEPTWWLPTFVPSSPSLYR